MSTDASNAAVVLATEMTVEKTLPADWQQANLVGRVMLPGVGPAVVYVNADGNVIDITRSYATTRDLFEEADPAAEARRASLTGTNIGKVADILANSSARDKSKPYLLSPADFQEIEAAGVTFVQSLVERMVEEAAMKEIAPKSGEKIDQARLDEVRERIRGEVKELVGKDFDFSKIVPGSEQAETILRLMKEKGISTIYPQVGLGKRGELFSKASVGLSVGHGAQAGYSSHGDWTNPEPEVVLFANSSGRVIGAAHGNDVNDRYTEGLSALYLHDAKVRNGSTAIGPFVRLFDNKFTLEDVKKTEVGLEVTAADGTVRFKGTNNMAKISRSPENIMAQATGPEHQRPDGLAVFLGTMTIPLKDEKGDTFTHKEGDVVRIGSPQLGYITNVMLPAEKVQGLEKGPLDLARNLAGRGVLTAQGQGEGVARPAQRSGRV